MRKIINFVVLIYLIVACSPSFQEEANPLSSAPPPTIVATEADQLSRTPKAAPAQAESPPSEVGESSPESAMVDKWSLWIDGPHLRGVDLHPCILFTVEGCTQPITRQDVQDLRDLGANLINASYPGPFTEEAPYEVNPTTLAYLDDLVGWAEEVGLYVVIHFRTGPGRNEGAITSEGDPIFDVWSDQAAHNAWVEMWRFTAERYRDSPVVVGYNLMVEPHPNTLFDPDGALEPLELQTQVEGTLLDWNAFAAEITAAIRQVDPDTPIIVNSLSWSSAAWFPALQPTGDPRTVYSLHAYDPDIYVIQEAGEAAIGYPDVVDDYGETIAFDRAWLEENYQPVHEFAQQHDVPIYVGEFGAVRWVPDAAAFLHDQTDLFEQYGWNYAVYVWRGDEPDFDGFNLEYGPDPENHAPSPDNPLLGVFFDRWAQNVDFPGNGTGFAIGDGMQPGQDQVDTEASTETATAASTLQRDFALPIPLFASDSAWNQTAAGAAILPESDQQILVIYRVLRGDITSIQGYDESPTTWPFMDISLDEYAIPVFRAGTGQQKVLLCNYDGQREWPHPKFGIDGEGGPVPVPAPAGVVRPAGPQDTDADGHLVLYNPQTFEEYDFWQATTVRDAECESVGGGQPGNTILEAGVIDFFDTRGPGANPDTLYSARAHGTPLLAGLILPEDIERGVIAHALALAIPGPRNTSADPSEPLKSDYFYPASTTETDFFNADPYALAAGQRIRLKQTLVDEEGDLIDENQLAPITRMFLTALRDYGAYVVDNAGGFSFTVEDIHTAALHLSDDEVNALIGQPPGTPLPASRTKWQVVIEKIGEELELIPIAYGPWEEGQDPATATIEVSNFEVVEPAIVP
jgi:hypothetical protein